ncbi:MAG: precorrin-6A synthase (deacetylating) [Rhizobiaceae bacterium]|nr:precorrin-6A synthase (deacetylating) [Rhizobiaceae bacterium]
MKRKLLVIGIGAGNPDYVTMQAVEAMNRADVFFIPDKGEEKEELARVRRELCERYIRDRNYRDVGFDVPKRRAPGEDGYGASVADWHERVEAVYRRLLTDEMSEGECGAFLVWGDPALYDSTMRILDRLNAHDDIEIDYEVIPGISAVQALTARHRVVLNTIGRSVLVSNGRSTFEGDGDADTVVVMLNADKALRTADDDAQVYWGAYLGMPDEVLVSGRLGDVREEIERIREEARRAKGWIMDSVLIRKPPTGD